MGTEQVHYIMLAARFDCDMLDDDSYEIMSAYDDNPYSQDIIEFNGISSVYDGMNGNYLFVGKILTKGNQFEGLPVVECIVSDEEKLKVKEAILRYWGHLLNKNTKNSLNISIYVFTHWH